MTQKDLWCALLGSGLTTVVVAGSSGFLLAPALLLCLNLCPVPVKNTIFFLASVLQGLVSFCSALNIRHAH